jgi:hypothetical protein
VSSVLLLQLSTESEVFLAQSPAHGHLVSMRKSDV